MAHRRSRPRARAAIIAATFGLLGVPATRAQVDLSGWWRIDQPTTAPPANLVHVTQVADAVTIPVSPPLVGSVNSTTLTGGPPATSYEYRLSPAADVIDGRRLTFGGPGPIPMLLFVDRLLLDRCGCNDGNAVDGDGCGADCQIEPCHTCTGDPSVCTPSPDGAACDDRHDCTTGETCSSGVCGGGSAITPCTDLTGTLDVHTVIPGLLDTTDTEDVVQRNGTFFLSGFVGSVDQSAGTARLASPIINPEAPSLCPSGDVFDELAGPAGPVGFSAIGYVTAITPTHCIPFGITVTAVRTTCGDGTLDPLEECGDGNRSPGDGCDGSCGIEKPQTGAPCQPLAACERSTKPQATVLELRNGTDPTKSNVTWKWPKGDSTSVAAFGDPTSTDAYELCLFDASGATPMLLFAATVPAGGTCDGKPCWKANRDNGFVYKNKEGTPDGLTGLTLKAGALGKASIKAVGKGLLLSSRPAGLPTPPLPVPLLVQLQRANGTCFEAKYGYEGVVQTTGRFRAHGTP